MERWLSSSSSLVLAFIVSPESPLALTPMAVCGTAPLDPLVLLPSELSVQVFSSPPLAATDLAHAAQVSRLWSQLVAQDRVWRSLALRAGLVTRQRQCGGLQAALHDSDLAVSTDIPSVARSWRSWVLLQLSLDRQWGRHGKGWYSARGQPNAQPNGAGPPMTTAASPTYDPTDDRSTSSAFPFPLVRDTLPSSGEMHPSIPRSPSKTPAHFNSKDANTSPASRLLSDPTPPPSGVAVADAAAAAPTMTRPASISRVRSDQSHFQPCDLSEKGAHNDFVLVPESQILVFYNTKRGFWTVDSSTHIRLWTAPPSQCPPNSTIHCITAARGYVCVLISQPSATTSAADSLSLQVYSGLPSPDRPRGQLQHEGTICIPPPSVRPQPEDTGPLVRLHYPLAAYVIVDS